MAPSSTPGWSGAVRYPGCGSSAGTLNLRAARRRSGPPGRASRPGRAGGGRRARRRGAGGSPPERGSAARRRRHRSRRGSPRSRTASGASNVIVAARLASGHASRIGGSPMSTQVASRFSGIGARARRSHGPSTGTGSGSVARFERWTRSAANATSSGFTHHGWKPIPAGIASSPRFVRSRSSRRTSPSTANRCSTSYGHGQPSPPARIRNVPSSTCCHGGLRDLAVDRRPVAEVDRQVELVTGQGGAPRLDPVAPRRHRVAAPEPRVVEVAADVRRRPDQVAAVVPEPVDPRPDVRQDLERDVVVAERDDGSGGSGAAGDARSRGDRHRPVRPEQERRQVGRQVRERAGRRGGARSRGAPP